MEPAAEGSWRILSKNSGGGAGLCDRRYEACRGTQRRPQLCAGSARGARNLRATAAVQQVTATPRLCRTGCKVRRPAVTCVRNNGTSSKTATSFRQPSKHRTSGADLEAIRRRRQQGQENRNDALRLHLRATELTQNGVFTTAMTPFVGLRNLKTVPTDHARCGLLPPCARRFGPRSGRRAHPPAPTAPPCAHRLCKPPGPPATLVALSTKNWIFRDLQTRHGLRLILIPSL